MKFPFSSTAIAKLVPGTTPSQVGGKQLIQKHWMFQSLREPIVNDIVPLFIHFDIFVFGIKVARRYETLVQSGASAAADIHSLLNP